MHQTEQVGNLENVKGESAKRNLCGENLIRYNYVIDSQRPMGSVKTMRSRDKLSYAYLLRSLLLFFVAQPLVEKGVE